VKKSVLVFGTFDGLHPGHRDFFRQAGELGEVTAIVARDSSVRKIKKNPPRKGERSRLGSVARLPEISRARLGDNSDFLRPIAEIQPDILALGYDQRTFCLRTLKSELKKRGLSPGIVRLKPFQPKKYKSSLLKK